MTSELIVRERSLKEYLYRYFIFAASLFIMAFGISLSIKADLGISPISSIPYVLSLAFPLSVGTFTIMLHLSFLLVQILLLRRNFELIQLFQIPVAFVFGYFTDLWIWLLRDFSVSYYPMKMILCLLSCVVIAFGVNLQVKAGVLVLSGEGMMKAISSVTHRKFAEVKRTIDCAMVVMAVIISLATMHRILGVREGTVIAAVLVGTFVHFYNKHLYGFYNALGLEKKHTLNEPDKASVVCR